MKRNFESAILGASALLMASMMALNANSAVLENEATTSCQTVISQKPGLDSFQYNDIQAESSNGGWRITGKISKGSDKRKFICKIDDRGRVASAVVAADSPAPANP